MNTENLGLQELSITEQQETNGGGILLGVGITIALLFVCSNLYETFCF